MQVQVLVVLLVLEGSSSQNDIGKPVSSRA